MHATCSAICSSQLQPPIAMKTWYIWYSKVHTILVLLNLSTLAVITTCFLQCLYCSDSCESTVQKDRATGERTNDWVWTRDLCSRSIVEFQPCEPLYRSRPSVPNTSCSSSRTLSDNACIKILGTLLTKLCMLIIVYSFFWNSLNCVSNLYSYNLTFCTSTTFRLALILKKSCLSGKN